MSKETTIPGEIHAISRPFALHPGEEFFTPIQYVHEGNIVHAEIVPVSERARFDLLPAMRVPGMPEQLAETRIELPASMQPEYSPTPEEEKFEKKLERIGLDTAQLLLANGIHIEGIDVIDQIRHKLPDIEKLLEPTRGENLADRLGGLMERVSPFLAFFSLNIVNLRRTASRAGAEGISYQAATGKNPNVNAAVAAALGLAELAISFTDWGVALFADILSVFGLSVFTTPAAFLLDGFIDTQIGNALERHIFPPTKVMGKVVEHRSIDNVVLFAGIAPWLPVAPTIKFIQWFGRYLLRKDLGKPLSEMPEKTQDALLQAASWATLRQYIQ